MYIYTDNLYIIIIVLKVLIYEVRKFSMFFTVTVNLGKENLPYQYIFVLLKQQ